jgi:predicted MFS family arabinose efflux permease
MYKSPLATRANDVNDIRVRLAAILCGCCFALFASIMPLTLARAADSLGLVEWEMGLLGGSFKAGVALACIVSVLWIRRLNWRHLVLLSSLALTADFLMLTLVNQFFVSLVCMVVAGLLAGSGYAVIIVCLGDTREPARNFALAFLCQSLVGTLVSYTLPQLSTLGDGFDITLLLLAGFSLCAAPLSLWLPSAGTKFVTATQPNVVRQLAIPPAVLVALAVIVLAYMGWGALWAFVEPIGNSVGLGAEQAGKAVAASLLAGAVGSLCAGVLSMHWGYGLPMLLSISASLASLIIIQSGPEEGLFITAIALYGWGWFFGASYVMGLVAELDSGGRFISIAPAMQTLGAAIGPVLAGLLVIDGVFLYVYLFSGLMWLLALLLFSGLLHYRRSHNKVESLKKSSA